MPRLVASVQDAAYARYYDNLPTPIEPVQKVVIPNHSVNVKDYGCKAGGISLCTDGK